MSDWPDPQPVVWPLSIPSYGPFSSLNANALLSGLSGAASARAWTANLVAYSPFSLPFPYPVARIWWINGSTITSTNVDCGIYTADGVRLYNTGSTAMVGASSVQYATAAPSFVLDAANYYFAWTCNNTTSRGYALYGSANSGRFAGLLQETTGAFGLPATMTPVAWAQAWAMSCCGVTRTTTGF